MYYRSSFIIPTLIDHILRESCIPQTKYLLIVNEALEIYNANVSIKIALGVALFANALNCLGSERHKKFYTDVWEGKVSGTGNLAEFLQ